MNGLPPLPQDPQKKDADHLNLLAIFHFVGAGLALIGILFLFVHYSIMHTMFTDPKIWANQKNPPPPELFEMFKWIYFLIGTWFLISCALNVISGLFLLRRKHRIFSMVVGGMNCLHIPLGTVLGVFTLIVLLRDSVQRLYHSGQPGPS